MPAGAHARRNPAGCCASSKRRGNNLRGVTVDVPARPHDLRHRRLGLGQVDAGRSTRCTATRPARCTDSGGEAAPCRAVEGLEQIDRVIDIDQSPIGRTPRSNPATYTGLFGPIRELFAEVPEARARGYEPGRFSFNVHGGRCEACEGDGVIKVEMHFLPDVYVPCDACRGMRYNRETLEIRYKGRNIHEVLEMTVEDAAVFFRNVPALAGKLQTLLDVGLSYVRLGQNATTLSGGEAQRVKLARELAKRATGRTLYILDEPTTGLHFHDIEQLLDVLHRLRDEGNTIVVIEHNLDVIKTADWIVDLGPEGGDGGGRWSSRARRSRWRATPAVAHRPLPRARAALTGASALPAPARGRRARSGVSARMSAACALGRRRARVRKRWRTSPPHARLRDTAARLARRSRGARTAARGGSARPRRLPSRRRSG